MSAATPYAVDPARLSAGRRCHKADKTLGEGDIHASYSADRIGMGKPVRRPFIWKNAPHVCVSMRHCGDTVCAEAYRLVHASQFGAAPTSYAQKLTDPDAARADPQGFYHGMAVSCGSNTLILCGPPVLFAPGKTKQLSLF